MERRWRGEHLLSTVADATEDPKAAKTTNRSYLQDIDAKLAVMGANLENLISLSNEREEERKADRVRLGTVETQIAVMASNSSQSDHQGKWLVLTAIDVLTLAVLIVGLYIHH